MISVTRRTFECIIPPLTVGTTAVALYQIFHQKSQPLEKKAILTAGVVVLGSIVLCATNKKARELFKKQFWDVAVSIFSYPENLEPVEKINAKLLRSSFERLEKNPHLNDLYDKLRNLNDHHLEIKNIRFDYLQETEIDLEEAAQIMQNEHQIINELEMSIIDSMQTLEQQKLLNKPEKALLHSLTAKKKVQEINHKIFEPSEVKRALDEQGARSKKQANKECNREFDAPELLPSLISWEENWETAPKDDFYYKLFTLGTHAAICESKGRREYMEDASLATIIGVNGYNIPLIGIFDGHKGSLKEGAILKASDYVQQRLSLKLEKNIAYFLTYFRVGSLTDEVLYNAMRHALIELHEEYPGLHGTTVNISLIVNDALYAANIGDSRSVFVDSLGKWTQLTEDAKADDPRHQKTIKDLGGTVVFRGDSWRISGVIGMGSALGDPEIVGINPTVDISKTPIPKEGGILLVASDGLWNAISSKNASTILYKNQHDLSPSDLSTGILNAAWHAGSEDNLSAIVFKMPGLINSD